MDLTILIHYFRDSRERERNLVAVCRWLLKEGCQVLVWADSPLPEGLDVPHIGHDIRVEGWSPIVGDCRLIHRTRALNELMKAARTRYVGIWDTDVIFPPGVMRRAYDQLKNHDAVYPYSGEFRRYQEYHSEEFAKTLDELWLTREHGYRLQTNRNMVGGAVMVDRKFYMSIGGENENFIAFAPEDKERFHRLSTMGRVYRVPGPLLHLNHPRFENSKATHKFQKQGEDEFQKVSKMNREEISSYVESWSWKKEFDRILEKENIGA